MEANKREARASTSLAVLSHYEFEGETYVELTCRDYEHLCVLPEVIDCQGQELARTGWNSDRQVAYYKSGCLVARPIDRKAN